MVWRIDFTDTAEKQIDRLGTEPARRVLRFLAERIAPSDDPRAFGQALKGSELGEFWKYRVGDHRIVARIEDDVVRILVVRVGHRREVYRR